MSTKYNENCLIEGLPPSCLQDGNILSTHYVHLFSSCCFPNSLQTMCCTVICSILTSPGRSIILFKTLLFMIVHALSPEHRSVRLSVYMYTTCVCVCMCLSVCTCICMLDDFTRTQHYKMGNFHGNLIDKAIVYWCLFIGGNYAQFITRSSGVTVDRIQKCLIQNL